MIAFAYDKSWEGLLSCLFRAYADKTFADVLLGPDEAPPLLATSLKQIETSPEMARRVMAGLKRDLSPLALRQVMYAWLSEAGQADIIVFRYMRKVFDTMGRIESNFSDQDVMALRKLWQKTAKAVMHVQQFVRFQKTTHNIYFAILEPDCNVLPLTLNHFVSRFADQKWVIYDGRRNYGFYYDLQQVREIDLQAGALNADRQLAHSLLTDKEKALQQAWRRYFKTLAIKERINPKLHCQHVPRRFWRYLTEKQD